MILGKSRAVRSDTHRCFLFPTYAQPTIVAGVWRLPVFGGVYRPSELRLRKRLLLGLIRRVMRVDASITQGPLFRERIRPFVSSGQSGLRMEIRVGGEAYPLRAKTMSSGLFQGSVQIERASIDAAPTGDDQTFAISVGLAGEPDLATSRVARVGSHGVSVVSDIDDTIKVTCVAQRSELLANTFTRQFRSVEGMAGAYRRWAAAGAAFHYVSSSPWQLFEPLHEMTTASGFPHGSMHLRSFRLRDHVLRKLLRIHRRGKRTEIARLFAAFPERKFVLVGDSGEKDPEIYGYLSERHPGQVKSIFIRNVAERPLDARRAERAFRGPAPWRTFDDPAELPESV